MEYFLKVNGQLTKNQIINATIEADSAYATICWIGVEHDQSGCFGDVEETFCEPIYIGFGDCSGQSSSSTITWHDCTIEYHITQLPRTDCDPCPTSNWCELIDMYVSPYYIPYSADSTSTVYYSYWQYNEADCEITRHKVSGSSAFTFTAEQTDKPCSADSRVITVSGVSIGCKETRDIDFYVKMPDMCCDKPSGICYEIGDVIYVDSSGSSGTQITAVEHSGGTVYFYFDYKMIDTDDKCNSKITYGRSKRIPWEIPNCKEGEKTSACCITSDIVSSYTWNDHASCIDGSSATTIPLSITRNRDYTRDDCRNVCSASTTYCIDGDISAFTMDNKPFSETPTFPSYGGKVKLRWKYNTYIQYDDCTSAFTSGNTWEDIVTIPPYSGECGKIEIVGDMPIKCSGDIQLVFSPNVSQTIEYPFKVAQKGDCNKVKFRYNQCKTICKETCTNCFSADVITFDASGGTYQLIANESCKGKDIYIVLPNWEDCNVDDDLKISVGATEDSREDVLTIFNGNCTDDIIIRQNGKHNCNIIPPPNIIAGEEVQFRIQ